MKLRNEGQWILDKYIDCKRISEKHGTASINLGMSVIVLYRLLIKRKMAKNRMMSMSRSFSID